MAVIVGAIVFLSSLLGPRKRGKVKDSPFECGFPPFQLPTDRFYIRFYLIAMLFILFDIRSGVLVSVGSCFQDSKLVRLFGAF